MEYAGRTLIGERLARVRESEGLTPQEVGRRSDLDVSVISRMESGEGPLRSVELARVAQVLGRPLAFFLGPEVSSVVSRRREPSGVHTSTDLLDIELTGFANDVRSLVDLGLLPAVPRPRDAHLPATYAQAENAARLFRGQLDNADAPLVPLTGACEELGLYSCVVPLGPDGPDGGCVEVATDAGTVGVAVVNGDAEPGRRRMTLAHELGHWLFGDAYDNGATEKPERMINAFAIHFLAPRGGVVGIWRKYADWPVRDRALVLSSTFRLSWSAALGQLRNLGLLGDGEYRRLAEEEPRRGDFLRRRLNWEPDVDSVDLSDRFVAGCLNGYGMHRLTRERTLEMLRGILVADDLPEPELTPEDFRPSFEGHSCAREA